MSYLSNRMGGESPATTKAIGHRAGIAAGASLLLVLAACQTTKPTVSVDQVVVSENESPLVFTDVQKPPMNGTYYKLTTNSHTSGGYVGVWSGRAAFPHARIIYTYLAPGYYYSFERDSDHYLDRLKLGDSVKITRGDGGHHVNVLGRASYRHFSAGPAHCVAFSQQFGAARRNSGNKKVSGHYCQQSLHRIGQQKVKQILDSIGIRDVALPANYSARNSGRTANTRDINFSGSWENRYPNLKGTFSSSDPGRNNGKVYFVLPENSGECVGNWSVDPESKPADESVRGIWTAICTNGLTAKGSYELNGKGTGHADGKDSDGNGLRFTFSI